VAALAAARKKPRRVWPGLRLFDPEEKWVERRNISHLRLNRCDPQHTSNQSAIVTPASREQEGPTQ
jgi:hypothetical protein